MSIQMTIIVLFTQETIFSIENCCMRWNHVSWKIGFTRKNTRSQRYYFILKIRRFSWGILPHYYIFLHQTCKETVCVLFPYGSIIILSAFRACLYLLVMLYHIRPQIHPCCFGGINLCVYALYIKSIFELIIADWTKNGTRERNVLHR